MSRLAAIVLAAGPSDSLGEPVQLIDWYGRTLLESMVGQLTSWDLDPVVVVLGWKADEILDTTDLRPAVVVVNYEWAAGLGASVTVGLDHLARERWSAPALFVLGNQPGITRDQVEALQAGHTGDMTVPIYRYKPGYPIIVDRIRWDDVMSRQLPPLEIAAAHPQWVTEIRFGTPPPLRIKVVSDVARARDRFGAA